MARIIEAQQGSPEWHKHRAEHYNGSDAPAMMGVSSYKSRGALLHEKKTGIVPDVDAATQKRFDKGHKYEAMARPWAEEIIGEDLYPVVLAETFNGMPLSSSLDGLVMDDSVSWEHKSLNDKLRQCIDNGDELPEQYRIQMEQGFLLSGARRCLFMASAGDKEQMRHRWYEHDPRLCDRVVNGWTQFNADLANYEPPAAEKVVTGSAPSALPALRIELSGAVAESNLDEFRDHATAVFDGISTDLQTDEHFANAEETVKWCKTVEQKLDAAKEHALSQTADIDRLFKTIDEISEQARKKRLELDKLVKSMKEDRKREIKQAAESDFEKHIGDLERELESLGPWPAQIGTLVRCDVAGPMKGKRTIATLQDAADTAVANAKIEADRIAREIRASIDVLKTEAEGYESLFPDGGQLVTNKTADDLRNLAKARIAEHQEQERQRAEREAEQKRLREERQAEAQRQHAEHEQAAAQVSPEVTTKAEPQPEQPSAESKKTFRNREMQRPTDDQIIECIANGFIVNHATARGWIAGMDMIGADA